MVKKWDLFINGRDQSPSTGQYLDIFSPSTGKCIGQVACGDENDLDSAVDAARTALTSSSWAETSVAERSLLLAKIATVVGQHAAELALLDVESCGATISRMTNFDVPATADVFMYYAEAVKHYPFVEHTVCKPLPESWHSQIFREPVGVCGLITAWNAPLLMFAIKIAPALAAGCTVVIKPSELTPTSSIRLAQLIADLLPPGVVNVVTGEGGVIGEAMSLHSGIDKISFTGSTRIGARIQKNAADTAKRVTLELGGKGAGIVLPDANLDLAASGAAFGVLLHSGQICASGTRLLVHTSIHDDLVERIASLMNSLKCGNPFVPQTGIGPISSDTQLKRILSYVDSAVSEGAQVVCGGRQVEVAGCEGGHFIEPTLIVGVHNAMKVAREEIFGPVLSVIPYETLEEAIAIANDSSYGLSAGIWTGDPAAAQKIAAKLKAGSVWINDWHMVRSDMPFGGYKQSGIGRELGISGMDAYVEIKSVTTAFESNPKRKVLHSIVLK
ncbi:MAG: aldehyde dehydrogenase [Porticoccaceae bacterium]